MKLPYMFWSLQNLFRLCHIYSWSFFFFLSVFRNQSGFSFTFWIEMLVNLVFKIMPRFFWWMYIDLRSFLTVIHHLEFKSHFVPLWIHCESVSPHFVIFLDNHCHNVLICCQQYYLTWYFLFLLTLIITSSFFASATMQNMWLVIPDPEKNTRHMVESFKEVEKKCTVILSPFFLGHLIACIKASVEFLFWLPCWTCYNS